MASTLPPDELARLAALLPSEEERVREAFYSPDRGFAGVVTATRMADFAALFGVAPALVVETAKEFGEAFDAADSAALHRAVARVCGAPRGDPDATLSLPAVCGFLGMVKAVVVLQSTDAVEADAGLDDGGAASSPFRRKRKPLFARLLEACHDIAPAGGDDGDLGVDRDALARACADIGIAFPPHHRTLPRTHELKRLRPPPAGLGASDRPGGSSSEPAGDSHDDSAMVNFASVGFRDVGAKRVRSRKGLLSDGGRRGTEAFTSEGALSSPAGTTTAAAAMTTDEFKKYFNQPVPSAAASQELSNHQTHGTDSGVDEETAALVRRFGSPEAYYTHLATAADYDDDGTDPSDVASDAYSSSSDGFSDADDIALNTTTATDPRSLSTPPGAAGASVTGFAAPSAATRASAQPSPRVGTTTAAVSASAAWKQTISAVTVAERIARVAHKATVNQLGRPSSAQSQRSAARRARLQPQPTPTPEPLTAASVLDETANAPPKISPFAGVSRSFAQALKAPLPGPRLGTGNASGTAAGGGSVAARRRLERQVAREPCTDPEQSMRLKSLAAQLRRSGVPDSGDGLGKAFRNAFAIPVESAVVHRGRTMRDVIATSPLRAHGDSARRSSAATPSGRPRRARASSEASQTPSLSLRGGGALDASSDAPAESRDIAGRRRATLLRFVPDEVPFARPPASEEPPAAGLGAEGIDDDDRPAHDRLGSIHALDPGARLVQLRRRLRSLEQTKRAMVREQSAERRRNRL